MEPGENDATGRCHDQRQAEEVGLAELDAFINAIPHLAVGDFSGEGEGHAEREQGRDHQGISGITKDWCFLTLFRKIDPAGKQKKPKRERAGDVDDTEVPGFHRERRQERDDNAGPFGDRQTVQGCHVKCGIKRCEGRD
jgi:hypothetical protein